MNYLVVGGAGFIGSYCVNYLLKNKNTQIVRVYDNFSSGKKWFLENHLNDSRLEIIARDIYDDTIFKASQGIDVCYLFAANPDIARAINEPDIDFKQGTALTQIVLESLRLGRCKRLIYASGSGVYGDVGNLEVSEDFSPMQPVSTYGASKLGCEALISSYAHMFELKSSAFRFGNVVGGRQTHGVAYDFINRLRINPRQLSILGDGTQSKPYVYIDDILSAMEIVLKQQVKLFDVYNVAPKDYTSVNEIADIVLQEMKITTGDCQLLFTGGNKGWKGDVPIVRLNTEKIRNFGWNNLLTSSEAVRLSVKIMLTNVHRLYNA